MATPTRSTSASTPKPPFPPTPSKPHPTASPRPPTSGSGTTNTAIKPLSYRSPAPPATSKPTSSASGHAQNTSLSPSHVDVPAMTATSPGAAAAMIASMGAGTGLTPLPTGLISEGLGRVVNGGVGSVVMGREASTMTNTVVREPGGDRRQRIDLVMRLLRGRVAGRGITREVVERVGQTEGFTTLWDDDSLTVAGNSVDLEIMFEGGEGTRDVVREVVLKIAAGGGEGAGEAQVQSEASGLLKTHLTHEGGSGDDAGPWPSLDRFSADVLYLGQHDRVESPVNCFEVVGGLYQAFRRIWDEEKTRRVGKDRSELAHVCRGNVGRPAVARGSHLGVSTEFWVGRHEFRAATGEVTDEKSETNSGFDVWSANFAVEKGEPSISSNRDWLDTESPLISSGNDSVDGTQDEKPNWKDTSTAHEDGSKDDGKDAMDIDKLAASIPRPLHIHFVARLEPSILVPINVIAEINAQSAMMVVDQTRLLTYEQVLQRDDISKLTQRPNTMADTRTSKSLTMIGKDGEKRAATHSYMLYSHGGAWCSPIQQLVFSHPRQFAEILPTLRQFALLRSMLRRSIANQTGDKSNSSTTDVDASSAKSTPAQSKITKRSNKKMPNIHVDDMLRGKPTKGDAAALNIDISMDLATSTSNMSLYVVVPTKASKFVQIHIEVGRNAIVDVVSIRGLPVDLDGDQLRSKAKKVLCLSEDIGVLVEWLIDQADQDHSKTVK